jgi:hypothetical protein
MCHTGDRDLGLQVGMARDQVIRVHPGVREQPLELVVEARRRLGIGLLIGEPDVGVTV